MDVAAASTRNRRRTCERVVYSRTVHALPTYSNYLLLAQFLYLQFALISNYDLFLELTVLAS